MMIDCMKKLTSFSISLAACSVALLSQGCTKQEEPSAPAASGSATVTTTPSPQPQQPTPPPLTDLQAAATNAATDAQALAQKQAAEAQAALDKSAADAQKAAETAAASTQDQIKALFEKIKGQIAEKKYAEATLSLNEVSQLKLTTEQQGWVEQMKAQVQKAMTSQALPEAAKSLDGFLNKK